MKKFISYCLCMVLLCVAMTACGAQPSTPAVTTDRTRLPLAPQGEASGFMATYTLEEAFSRADAVIVAKFTKGQVLTYEYPQGPEYVDYYYEYSFEVTEWIRGSTPKELFILQYKGGCGKESYYYDHQLEEGREYLIPLSPQDSYSTVDGRYIIANCVIDLDDPQKSAINGESDMDKWTELSWDGAVREEILTYVQSLITPKQTKSLEELVQSAECVIEVTVQKKVSERLSYRWASETFECSVEDILKMSTNENCQDFPTEQDLKGMITLNSPYQAVNEGDTLVILVKHCHDSDNTYHWLIDVELADEKGFFPLEQKDEILSYID